MHRFFADVETSTILKELGFNEGCYTGYLHSNTLEQIDSALIRNKGMAEDWISAPIWQQVKQWLWENHKIRIDVLSHGVFPDCDFVCTILLREETLIQTVFQTPMEAEIEGIKKAVEYLSQVSK